MTFSMHFDDRGQHRPGHEQSLVYLQYQQKKNWKVLTLSASQSCGHDTISCMNPIFPFFPMASTKQALVYIG